MKVHPISYVILKPQGQGLSKYPIFASLFNAMKDKFSVLFQLKPQILSTKIVHQCEIFGFLSTWVKIHEVAHLILQITGQFFFKLCITFQCHETKLLCIFSPKSLYTLEKRTQSKGKFQTFDCSHENKANSLCYFSSHKSMFL